VIRSLVCELPDFGKRVQIKGKAIP
jgi:hypothetical protein